MPPRHETRAIRKFIARIRERFRTKFVVKLYFRRLLNERFSRFGPNGASLGLHRPATRTPKVEVPTFLKDL
jgi:hypothetical protein